MNAVVKPRTLFEDQLDAVRYHGAPGAHLEANEVPQWCEENGASIVGEFSTALSDFDGDEKQWARLLPKLMGDMTADELIEFRDLCRSRFLDYCIKWQQRMIDQALGE